MERLKNKNNEKLYLVSKTTSKDIHPYCDVFTWEGAEERFLDLIKEEDSKSRFCKLVNKTIVSQSYAQATLVENLKGWGNDYMVNIEIQPLYISL